MTRHVFLSSHSFLSFYDRKNRAAAKGENDRARQSAERTSAAGVGKHATGSSDCPPQVELPWTRSCGDDRAICHTIVLSHSTRRPALRSRFLLMARAFLTFPSYLPWGALSFFPSIYFPRSATALRHLFCRRVTGKKLGRAQSSRLSESTHARPTKTRSEYDHLHIHLSHQRLVVV